MQLEGNLGGGQTKQAMTVKSNGNVGIGTTDPQALFSVNNQFLVEDNGYVTATEIWVKQDVWVQNYSPWNDYVFEPEYKLMPITELETYIAENKHLPEVPSAVEVGKNGFRLAEMDALQLKKIEELTLYIIQLQKQLDEQQKEINKLKNKEE